MEAIWLVLKIRDKGISSSQELRSALFIEDNYKMFVILMVFLLINTVKIRKKVITICCLELKRQTLLVA